MMIDVRPTLRRFRAAALVAGGLAVLIACEESITGLTSDFLIRRPTDSLIAGAPSFNVSATATTSLRFEWEPVPTAQSYSIIFKQAESVDSMNRLEVDFTEPTFTLEIESPQLMDVLLTPADSLNPKALRTTVVYYDAPAAMLDSILADRGVPRPGVMNTVWTIEAHRGRRSVRSIELQRMIFRRQ